MTFLAMTLSVERHEQPGNSVICKLATECVTRRRGVIDSLELKNWHMSWWLRR